MPRNIELNRRKEMGYTYSFKNPFSGKLICEDCGSYYGKKKWHSGTIHEKEILQCNFKFKHKCKTPNLDEEEVKSMFLKAYNEMIRSKDVLITNLIEAVSKALDTSSLDKKIEALSNELKDMNKEFELLVNNVDKTMREIRDIIRDQILPSTEGLCEIGSLLEDDKTVITIRVTKGTKLYYIKKEGRSATGCFYRDGTSSTPMSEEEIERRFIKTYSKHLSMIETPSSQKDFSFNQLKIYYSSKGYHLNDETLVDNLRLKTDEGRYNFLAELLSDENRISIKVARFQGEDKSVLLEKSEYGYQCLLVAIDRVINRLEAENITKSRIVGAQRVDKRLMDMASLREVFINAIAHNDWSIVEPAVYIFSNHIEVISHGGLPDGETKEMFFKGISTPRNKELMRVLSDLKYVEQTGYGVPEVLKHYDKNVFDIEENYINVSIPYDAEVMASMHVTDVRAEHDTENDTEKTIISAIKSNPYVSQEALAKLCNKSRITISRIIKKSNKIKRVGPDKGGHWEIIDQNID